MFVIVHPPTPPPQSLTPEIPEKSPEPKFERNVVCLPFPPVFSGTKSFLTEDSRVFDDPHVYMNFRIEVSPEKSGEKQVR